MKTVLVAFFTLVQLQVAFADITATRTITQLSANEFKVEVNISASTITGFARLKENIPSGFTADKDNVVGGDFKVDGDAVKIIWLSLPSGIDGTISYTISGTPSGESFDVTGEFKFNDNDEVKTIPIAKSTFAVEGTTASTSGTDPDEEAKRLAEEEAARKAAADAEAKRLADEAEAKRLADEEAARIAAAGDEEAKRLAAEKAAADEAARKAAADAEAKRLADEAEAKRLADEEAARAAAASASSSSAGVVMKVQVLAGRGGLDQSYFNKKFGISDAVKPESHGNITKYVIGPFSNVDDAKKAQERMKQKGVTGAFVVYEKGGKRVSKSEAGL
jgi:hypothetical protein